MLARSDMILASVEDLTLLFGDGGLDELRVRRPGVETVLKLAEPAVRIFHGAETEFVPAVPVPDVVDTTAAGDSFAAGYMTVRFAGAKPAGAARAAHRLAGAVVRHRGAIIPRSAMPDAVAVA
jgi:2-dehydro-3-deoxygluconokinase